MKPAPFTYHDPRTLADAVALLGLHENAKLLAGGQSLMPMLNLRLLAPGHVIDLGRVAGLTGVAFKDGFIEIGAMTRQSVLHTDVVVAEYLPILRAALDHVGHMQTRSRGTIGGSCCHLDPAAEIPAICALYGAEFVVAGTSGQRTVAARDWFRGFLDPAIGEGEVLQTIRFPVWPDPHGFGFHEYARRHGDFAIVGAAALLSLDEMGTVSRASIAVFGVGHEPVRLRDIEAALIGQKPVAGAFVAAADAARKIDAIGDPFISSAYRQRLAAAMVSRALEDAARTAEIAR